MVAFLSLPRFSLASFLHLKTRVGKVSKFAYQCYVGRWREDTRLGEPAVGAGGLGGRRGDPLSAVLSLMYTFTTCINYVVQG